MKAKLLLRERHLVDEGQFAELVIWQVPVTAGQARRAFKYRLAFVVDGACVVRFDNEAGKGDHKHIGKRELPYRFTDPERLLADFWHEVERWRAK